MAVSGLPEPCESHARCIARLALDIMDLSKRVKYADLDGIVIILFVVHLIHFHFTPSYNLMMFCCCCLFTSIIYTVQLYFLFIFSFF